MSPLDKCLFSSATCFLMGFWFFFFNVELHDLFVYFGDQSFVSCFICKYFAPILRVVFLSCL